MVRTLIFVCFLCATLLLITVFLNPLGNTLRQTIPISRLALGRLRNKELESAAENNTRNVTQKPFVILVYTEFFGTKEWLKITDDCSSPEIPRNSCRKDDRVNFPEKYHAFIVTRPSDNVPSISQLNMRNFSAVSVICSCTGQVFCMYPRYILL